MKIETERLILRPWGDRDIEPFVALCADPEVMEWLGGCRDRDAAVDYIARSAASFRSIGMGRFAIGRRTDGAFMGFCGLMPGHESLPIAPFTDIGWGLTRGAWGAGYATEAARAVLRDGFGRLKLTGITAMTAAVNHRSRAVMERLDMIRDVERDFDHPAVPPNDPKRRTVVYQAVRP